MLVRAFSFGFRGMVKECQFCAEAIIIFSCNSSSTDKELKLFNCFDLRHLRPLHYPMFSATRHDILNSPHNYDLLVDSSRRIQKRVLVLFSKCF